MTRCFLDDDRIERLALGVIDATCPKSQWTHAAHFAVALWMVRHWPPGAAEADMPAIIRRYNEATGVANTDDTGYRETITQASIAVARAFLDGQPPSLPLHEGCSHSWPAAAGSIPTFSPFPIERSHVFSWRRAFRMRGDTILCCAHISGCAEE